MSCCLVSQFPVLLYPVITFPQFFLSVFLLFLLRPMTSSSNQDWDPTVPDTKLALYGPVLVPSRLNAAEEKQTKSWKAIKRCRDSTWLIYSLLTGHRQTIRLCNFYPTSLWCCITLNYMCVRNSTRTRNTERKRGLWVLNIGIMIFESQCIWSLNWDLEA